ncbi:MAG: flagellar basal body P-ring formation chaperone FlgA [Holosporales bacterium]|jgi:flagella basal body P-ring formation protein FlgA|nr:flagellar basal body P-ring formation chaperone FlgA [Holosporales bacterium]
MKKIFFFFCLLLGIQGNADVIVHGEEVRLSDLFELPDGVQDIFVMPAPALGQQKEISAAFLETIAKKHHLSCAELHTVHVIREVPTSSMKRQKKHTVQVPVFIDFKRSGDIIGAKDLTWKAVSEDRIGNSIIKDPQEIIGKTVCSFVRAEVPVRFTDVRKPILIKRNTFVMLRVKMQNLLATVRGKALEEGGCGDTIRVVNTQSGKVVEGIVHDNRIVDIVPIQG